MKRKSITITERDMVVEGGITMPVFKMLTAFANHFGFNAITTTPNGKGLKYVKIEDIDNKSIDMN